jgi:hypothetical protein
VNDGGRRQLVSLDDKLANVRVLMDSVPRDGLRYGNSARTMMPYVADSMLMVDVASRSLIVLDPNGKVVRTMSVPNPRDISFIGSRGDGVAGVDPQGRLVYRGLQAEIPTPSGDSMITRYTLADRAPILRANFKTQAVDTVGNVRIASTSTERRRVLRGNTTTTYRMNPAAVVDAWAVLSDGTMAIVRGQDYHIDWMRPDGSTTSTPKVEFPWKTLSDADKANLFETSTASMNRNAATNRADYGRPDAPGAQPPMRYESVPTSEYPDYYPAIRTSGVHADRDANLWVLTTATTNAAPGEKVFDVFNNRGVLTQRVRVPESKQVVGFGKGGVVYLAVRDIGGFVLERTRVSDSN